jgi:hypothetical protein
VKTGCNTLVALHPVFYDPFLTTPLQNGHLTRSLSKGVIGCSVTLLVLVGDEVLFAYAANGAAPIVGKILKRGAGSDTAVGIALCGVINVAARLAHIFHAGFLLS